MPTKVLVDALPPETLLADRKNMLYMGTTISTGRAVGIVTATGMKTELGKIANDIAEAETPKTPLEHKLESLGKFLGFIALIVAALIVSIALIVEYVDGGDLERSQVPILGSNRNICRYSSRRSSNHSVTTLAIGMRNMARHKAIIRRMKAVETLGSTTVICTDKTGTLTKNQMTVKQLMLPYRTFGITGEDSYQREHCRWMVKN